jgi:pimeloyl-ACP methyl ester carboxylesterase
MCSSCAVGRSTASYPAYLHLLLPCAAREKAVALERQAKQQGHAYLRLDCSGHGQSSGDMVTTGPGDWLQDVLAAMDVLPADKPLVLVGGWPRTVRQDTLAR